MREKKMCPTCGVAAVVPIGYGEPSVEVFEAADRKEIILGGCCVSGHDPQWGCTECDGRFFSEDEGQTLTPAERDPLRRW